MGKFSNKRKTEIVLGSFQDGVVITQLCRKHGISRSTFYRHKKLVLEAITSSMQKKDRGQQGKKGRNHSTLLLKNHYRCRFK